MNSKTLQIPSGKLLLHGVLVTPDQSISKGIIFFHGGGHANAERYHDVQEFFSKNGIASLAFSFRGCGSSEGDFSNSTLLDRVVDAESALSALKLATGLLDTQLYIWGSSMGGHVACRLISKHPQIKGLILQSAAAYRQAAESQPFGPKFTDSIMEENNWDDSRAFTDLRTYQNPTLIIYGQADEVIPDKIKGLYLASTKYPQYEVIRGYGHPMLRPITQVENEAWVKMVNLALNFISEQ